ncbi:MAG: AAA family ATPase [Planctomycetota bacterium]
MRLLGQSEEFERLLAAAVRHEVPHGLVLEGLPGGGKSTAARVLASALLAAGDPAVEARVRSGLHADLHVVDLPQDRQDIPIDRVRELQVELERRPVEGRARVAIVDPADRLNEQGQNALLKTLEEPGDATFLLLVTSRPEALLETVRSRCRRVRLLPLAGQTIRDELIAESGEVPGIALAVAASGGSLGLARELLGEEAREVGGVVAGFLADPRPAAVADLRGLLDRVSGRTETERRMEWVARLARGLLRTRIRDTVSAVAQAEGASYGPACAEPWLSALEAVFDAEQDLSLGIPAAQVLEGLGLRLVTVLGGGAPAA